jgi:hypothetical protein
VCRPRAQAARTGSLLSYVLEFQAVTASKIVFIEETFPADADREMSFKPVKEREKWAPNLLK